jgi:hypothetical protein
VESVTASDSLGALGQNPPAPGLISVLVAYYHYRSRLGQKTCRMDCTATCPDHERLEAGRLAVPDSTKRKRRPDVVRLRPEGDRRTAL